MLKLVNLFICLSVLFLSDVTSFVCFENPGACPQKSAPCDLPLPLLQQEIPACVCDFDCKSTHKCCETSCYSYQICVPSVPIKIFKNNALETNVKASPLNHIDDNIKKIFKQVQDSIPSDKEIKQLSNYQENSVQGQKENVAAPEIKVNVFFNIIKKYYIQNLNIYKGGDKSVDGSDKINNEIRTQIETNENTQTSETLVDEEYLTTEDLDKSDDGIDEINNEVTTLKETNENKQTNDIRCGTIDDEDCLATEGLDLGSGSGSGSGPTEPQPSTINPTEASDHIAVTVNATNITKHPQNQGCQDQDDEDCQPTEGSGYNFEGAGSEFGSEIAPEASGVGPNSGSEQLDHILIDQSDQIELPEIVATKYKTLDGTHHLFFDKEVHIVNDAGVTIDVEEEIEI